MNNLIDTKEIEGYKKELMEVQDYVLALEVVSDEGYGLALKEAKKIKTQLESITARKEQITKPLNSALKSVRDLFKPIEAAGESAYEAVKMKMIAFTDEKEKGIEQAKGKIDARLEKGTLKESTANVKKFLLEQEMSKTVSTEAGSATTKKVKKYYVVDKNIIPIEFLEPDMVKIKASFKSGFPVPGIEEKIESELSIS